MNKRNFKNKSFFKNKKGYSLGFTWIFGLVSLFAIGVIFIVFDQVFVAHLVPVIKTQVNNTAINNIDSATVTEINNNIDRYMNFWHYLPFVLFFVVCIYMIVAAIRRERDEQQY